MGGVAGLGARIERWFGGRAVLWVACLGVLLYAGIAASTLGSVGLSADGVSTWATGAPHRTVLCLTAHSPPRITLAAAPSEADEAAVKARLFSGEHGGRLGPLGLHLRPHAYRATVSVFGVELPWMKNDYTAGWQDLPAHVAWALTGSPRAGQAVHLAMGALVLLLAALVAGRLGGAGAAAVAAVWLATDPWFHIYKRLIGAYDVGLQLAAMAAAALLVHGALRKRRSAWLGGALALGIGLHLKPSFAAVIGAFAVASPLVWWGLSRGAVVRGAASAAAMLMLGFAPTLLFQAADAAFGGEMVVGQESAAGRLAVLRGGGAGDELKGGVTALDVAVRPRGYWREHWRRVGASTSRARAAGEPVEPSLVARGAEYGAWALLLFAGLGAALLGREAGGLPGGERRVAAAVGVVAVLLPVGLRALSPDPHHLALWVPFFAVALGLGLSRWVRGRGAGWVVALVACVAVTATGRGLDLRGIDQDLVGSAGRLSVAGEQARLAEALIEVGATDPAFLDYNAMSVIEGWSGGTVRPWLYSRASMGLGEGCLRGDSRAFLRQVLRAHAGGHVVIVAGPPSGPGGRPDPYRSTAQIQEAAVSAGVTVREVRRVEDARGRWMASIWGVE